MRYLIKKWILSWWLVGGILSESCIFQKPEFPIEPSITFRSISKKSLLDANGQVIEDSIFLDIDFRDGDGDIGLGPEDTTGKFARRRADNTFNPYYYNFYCTIYRRNKFTGVYERLPLPRFIDPITNTEVESNIHGRVPPLSEKNKLSPIEGTIRYNIGGLYYDVIGINKRDSIRFEVFIYDRALHQSNTITTPAILVNE